jgi:hypothetical protein
VVAAYSQSWRAVSAIMGSPPLNVPFSGVNRTPIMRPASSVKESGLNELVIVPLFIAFVSFRGGVK